MTKNASLQLSLGRFPVVVEPTDTIKQAKRKFRQSISALQHLPLGGFRIKVGGTFLSDESKTVDQWGLQEGDVLHFVKKTCCVAAAVDTEKKAEE